MTVQRTTAGLHADRADGRAGDRSRCCFCSACRRSRRSCATARSARPSESIINGLRAATTEAANRNTTVTFELASATGADWTCLGSSTTTGSRQQTIQSYSKKEAGREHEDHDHAGRQDVGHVQRTRPGRHRSGERPTTTSGRSTSIRSWPAKPARCASSSTIPTRRPGETARTPHVRPRPRACRARRLPIRGPAEMKLPPRLPRIRARPADRKLPARSADRDPHLRVRRPRPHRPARQLDPRHQRRPLSIGSGEPRRRDDRRHVDDDRRPDGHAIRRRRHQAHGLAGQGRRPCCRPRPRIRRRST